MDLKAKEKQRELTEDEKRRLDDFEDICYDMKRIGYRETELTISIVAANIFGLVFAVPVFALGFAAFIMKNGTDGLMLSLRELLLFIVGLIVLIVLHEFVHGLVWGMYAEHYYKDIHFGIVKKYLTPYCTCTMPLRKGPYIAGGIMPLIVLGILPSVASVFNGSYLMLLLGLIMTVAAAGDIMIVWQLLRYKTDAKDVFCLDHPTMSGLVIFER